MKLTSELIKYINICISQIIQQVVLKNMQPKQNIPILRKDNNTSDNYRPYLDTKSIHDKQDIRRDHRDLVSKSLDTSSYARNSVLECCRQDRLLTSELSLFLIGVRWSEKDFLTGKSLSDIKYYHLGFQNDNLYYLFNDQLNYMLSNYFKEFETKKCNVNQFLSDPLMAPFIKKRFYQNVDKWIEKLSKIPWGIQKNK